MANKLDTVLDNVATALAGLVTDGHLTSIERRLVHPRRDSLPVLGLVIARFSREQGATWTAEALLMLAASTGSSTADQTITDLIARVADAVETVRAAGNLGGAVDRPVWDPWYAAANPDSALAHVGAVGSLRIRVEDPLLVEE